MLVSIVLNPYQIIHDSTVYLSLADFILDGYRPYVDYVETNFPMAQLIHVPVVLISRILHINPILPFKLSILALALISILTIHAILSVLVPETGRFIGSWFGLGVALITLQAHLTFTFGQREHMFLLLYLPGFLVRWIRWEGGTINKRLAIVVGLAAGIGASIKPFFLLMVLAVEVFWFAWHRDYKPLIAPEVAGFAIIGLLHAIGFLVFPAVFKAFVQMNRVSTMYYIPERTGSVLLDLASRPVLLIIVLAAFSFQFSRDRLNRLIPALAVLALAGIAIVLIQGREGYRYLPAQASAALIAILILADWLWRGAGQTNGLSRVWQRGITGKATGLLLVGLLAWTWMTPDAEDARRKRVVDSEFHQLIRETTQPGDRVAILTTSVSPVRVLVQTGRKLGMSVVTNSWFDPAAPNPETLRLDWYERDIENLDPVLIAIDRTRGLYSYLQDIGFIQDEIMPEYGYVGNYFNGDQTTLAVYQHIGTPPPMEAPLRFGDQVEMEGWRVHEETEVHPCQSITFDSWWKPLTRTEAAYSMTLTLVQDEQGIAQSDGPVAGLESVDWQPGGQLADQRTLTIPCDLQPGDYPLLVALYDVRSGRRLTISQADAGIIGDYYYVTSVTVAGEGP